MLGFWDQLYYHFGPFESPWYVSANLEVLLLYIIQSCGPAMAVYCDHETLCVVTCASNRGPLMGSASLYARDSPAIATTYRPSSNPYRRQYALSTSTIHWYRSNSHLFRHSCSTADCFAVQSARQSGYPNTARPYIRLAQVEDG